MCPECSRRDFVRLTLGAGLGLSASGLGLAAQETRTSPSTSLGAGKAKACILLWLAGGPSQVDTFDPKPDLTPFKAIETASGAKISEGFPRLAKRMKDVSLLRTVHSNDPNHPTATYLLHTSYRKMGGVEYPHVGSLITAELGERTDLPGCIVIGCDPKCGAGYLPGSLGPVVLDKLENPAEDIKLAVAKRRFEKRWKLLDALDRRFAEAQDAYVVDERRQAYERARQVLTSEKVKAFDLSGEKKQRRYGNTAFGRACLTARRLVEAGARFVEVALGDWDSHQDNEKAHRSLMETLDPAYAALLSDLKDRRLLDETLVVCMGEFGRTPSVNNSGGRDHYTKHWSVAMSGGGVAGGRVVGETDGRAIVNRPVTIQDLFSTFYKAFGIDSRKERTARGGRPLRLVDGGTPVQELF